MSIATPTLLLVLAASGTTDDVVTTTTDTAEVVATDPVAQPEAPRPDLVAPVLTRDYAIEVNRRARGLGIGFRQGLWGQGFGQSLHLDVPFGRRVGQFFGARLTGTVVHGEAADRYDPVAFGSVELFGRSPVLGGLIRIYGGGGVMMGGRLHPRIDGRRYGIAGGGHMGIEAFAAPRVSFSIEVGGQGPVHALGIDGGASVMGGMSFWFGRR